MNIYTFIIITFVAVFGCVVHAEEEKKEQPLRIVKPDSIYARLGGQESIDAAVDLFYKKILADDEVNHFFENVNMKVQIRRQKEFLSSAFGGPKAWTGKDLKKAHANLDLDDRDFAAIAGHLNSTLKDLKVEPKLHKDIMTLVASTKDDVLNRPKKEKTSKKDQ